MAIKLSVVLPSWKDPLLFKTIEDLLKNSALGDQLEIIAVWDAYWPDPNLIIHDPRVRYIHRGQNGGMRRAINDGVAISRGEFFMRLDEHCCFGQGYDKILTDACKPDEIMTATRYFLDPVRWEVMDIEPVYHEKLVIQDGKKFAGQRWRSRDEALKDEPITETTAMQGSMWIMPKAWWDKHIKELQTEGYGPSYQDSVEVTMKTWQAGGRLMLNKNTWYAHKHRDFPRTHNEGTKENPSNREAGWQYSLDMWRPYYEEVVRPRFGI